jgi:hypothetical protein
MVSSNGSIARHTNVLALNASFEAARAVVSKHSGLLKSRRSANGFS